MRTSAAQTRYETQTPPQTWLINVDVMSCPRRHSSVAEPPIHMQLKCLFILTLGLSHQPSYQRLQFIWEARMRRHSVFLGGTDEATNKRICLQVGHTPRLAIRPTLSSRFQRRLSAPQRFAQVDIPRCLQVECRMKRRTADWRGTSGSTSFAAARGADRRSLFACSCSSQH